MKPVYDPETMTFKSPEAAKAEAKEAGLFRVSIGQELADQLLACGDADGLDRVADTPTGQKVRATGIIKLYVEQAIQEFLTARDAVAVSEE